MRSEPDEPAQAQIHAQDGTLVTVADSVLVQALDSTLVAEDSTNTHPVDITATTVDAMPQYTSRDVGDPTQIKKNKQSMADLKLRRLTELNNRLREDLERERIPVSQASKSIIAYCNSTRDYMVPSVWGVVPKGEDPYAPQQSGGCCLVM